MRTIKEIIIHCSATPQGKNYTVADIDRWHRQRKFRCIGYHYVIYLDGSIHPGRPENQIGAHCAGHNAQSLGICYIGGMDSQNIHPADSRTPQQRTALLNLLTNLSQKYPNATIHSHSDFANKACPSFNATTEYQNISSNQKK